MRNWLGLMALVFVVSACFEAGELEGEDAVEDGGGIDAVDDGGADIGGDTGRPTADVVDGGEMASDATDGGEVGRDVTDGGEMDRDVADSGEMERDATDGGLDTGSARDTSARDTSNACGGCPAQAPACVEETRTCVECLDDGDCGGGTPICIEETHTCAPCTPDEETDFYPDVDGDGYGDQEAQPTSACSAPAGMVDNAKDCDDGNKSVHPGADEVCNGRDDDCDGTGDANDSVVAANCGKQKGICQGATIATCNASGSDYATCGSNEYGSDYRQANDEAWRCDNTDNDCDGKVDEACCSAGTTPSPTTVKKPDDAVRFTAIVPAVGGAPAGAEYLVAWAFSGAARLQHVDASGSAVKTSEKIEYSAEPRGMSLVPTSGGYALAVARETANQWTFRVYRLKSDLSQKGSHTQIEASTSDMIAGAGIAADGGTVWVAYSKRVMTRTFAVRAAGLSFTNGQITSSPKKAGGAGWPTEPSVAVVGSTATVAWWDGSGDVRGGRPQHGESFRIAAGGGSKTVEPVSLLAHGGEAHLVYATYTGSSTSKLRHVAIGSNQTGTLSGGTDLTGATERNRVPEAVPVDRSGDGSDDHLLIGWQQGTGTSATIAVGRMSLSAPGSMAPRAITKQGNPPSHPALATDGGKAGAVWEIPPASSKAKVEYAPVSIDGIPVCN